MIRKNGRNERKRRRRRGSSWSFSSPPPHHQWILPILPLPSVCYLRHRSSSLTRRDHSGPKWNGLITTTFPLFSAPPPHPVIILSAIFSDHFALITCFPSFSLFYTPFLPTKYCAKCSIGFVFALLSLLPGSPIPAHRFPRNKIPFPSIRFCPFPFFQGLSPSPDLLSPPHPFIDPIQFA